MKTVLEVIGIVFVLSIVVNIVTMRQVLSKASAFCDKEAMIGKSSTGLIEKSKQAGAKFYLSGSTLNIYFTGSYRPAMCRITLHNDIVTAKYVEIAD